MKKDQTINCCYLYRHIRLDTLLPFYIGIGSDLHFKRASDKKGRNKHWHSIVVKTAYRVEILLKDLNWIEACKKESDFIRIHGRKDLGLGTLCNMTIGGDGAKGVVCRDETRVKLSLKSKGRKARLNTKNSKETREKISIGNKGKTLSEETKQKMSYAAKGKTHTKETKSKLSQINKGKSLSKETKQKISEATKGSKNPMFGKVTSEAAKIKMSKVRKGKITSELTKQKISEANIGKPKSEETKANMKAAWVLRKLKQIAA